MNWVPPPDPHEQPYRELSDEPEPDDARGLTEGDLGAPYALHGDGPDRRERRVLRCNAVRNGDAQIRWYPIHLSVQRELIACRGY